MAVPTPVSVSPIARVRRSSLRVKLAALGATVTAAVLGLALLALSEEVRSNTRTVFGEQLVRNQRTIQQLQARDRQQLAGTQVSFIFFKGLSFRIW